MLKSEKGVIDINGTGAEILADFACLTHALVYAFKGDTDEEDAKKILTDTFNDGLNCTDEVEEESTAIEVDVAGLKKQLKEEKANG